MNFWPRKSNLVHISCENMNSLSSKECIKTLSIFCCISYHLTNNEELVDIYKYNLYFYSLTATLVWSRNAVRESSHLSFFCVGRKTHTGELTGLLEWLADLCLRLRDQRISPLRLSDQQTSTFSPKLQCICCLFKSHVEVWTSSSLHVFSVHSWLSDLTYFRFFFGNFCVRKYLSFNPLIKDYIFIFPVKSLCWCYFTTALNLFNYGTLSLAKLVYYISHKRWARANFYHKPWRTKGKITMQSFWINSSILSNRTFFVLFCFFVFFSQMRKPESLFCGKTQFLWLWVAAICSFDGITPTRSLTWNRSNFLSISQIDMFENYLS